jgi:two-component system phosphate regulon sensor histidine kinase PhoR
MNLLAAGAVAALLAAAAGASLALAGGHGMPAIAASVLCGGLAVAALVAASRSSQRAIATFRDHVENPSDEAPPPSLPGPLDRFAGVAFERIATLSRDLELRTAESKRARLLTRANQNEHAALRALLDNLGDGILLFDSARNPLIANAAARRFLAIPPDGELPSETCDVLRRPALRPLVEQALKGESRESLASRDVDASDETERLVLRVAFQEIQAPAAAPTDPPQLAVLMKDVTREVELNRMKSDFASSVSHELKTPLCSMKAFLEMILDGDIDGDEERDEHLRMILNETDRLTTLVQNLLNLSRLEAGITKMARDPVAIGDLLRHVEDICAPLARARGQTIRFEVSEFLSPVTGDVGMLEQAIMNLVSNAIKYTPEGGKVDVVATLAGSCVEVRVRDTGVGIPEKALDTIFQKFTRLENHAGLKATGTGLGLPLAKFVAEAHGGSIKVGSEVGKGSEFRLLLPTRRALDSKEAVLVGLEGIGR